jgi:hypothetical protein
MKVTTLKVSKEEIQLLSAGLISLNEKNDSMENDIEKEKLRIKIAVLYDFLYEKINNVSAWY